MAQSSSNGTPVVSAVPTASDSVSGPGRASAGLQSGGEFGGAQLQTLLAQTSLGIAACDATGALTFLSPALQTFFGKPFERRGEAELAEHFRLYDADGDTAMLSEDLPLARARRGEMVKDAVLSTRSPTGEASYLRCNAAPLVGDAGAIVGAVALVQDITGERQQRCEQDELHERLVVTINHEFRTPLTKLVGHVELLQDIRDRLPEEAHRSLDMISRAGAELTELIEIISRLAELESPRRPPEVMGDLASVARELAAEFQDQASARGLVLATDIPERLSINDPQGLGKAIAALMSNAVIYAPAGSVVELRVSADPMAVQVSVCDSGTGIASQDRARLVRPFQRGAHPRQPVNSTGLGLTVAHTVATAQGGRLILTENSPHGLRACLVIPRSVPEE